VFQQQPTFCRGLIVAHGLHNRGRDSDLEAQLRRACEEAAQSPIDLATDQRFEPFAQLGDKTLHLPLHVEHSDHDEKDQRQHEARADDEDPLDISWTYMVLVHMGLRDRSDSDLVQMFQRAVSRALRRFYAGEAEASINVPVEVRRVYHSNEQGRPQLSYVQLVSSNITNLLDQWDFQDSGALRRVIRNEVTLAGAIIQALRDTFNTNTRNSNTYRPVDTA
ncbi:MAG: hypothetical protein HC828_18785, partial [Blastochloris sp.]|nr:hypothetical protein [Blastochloris sp.]